MIEKLEKIIEFIPKSENIGTQISRPPNELEMMDKINEIIEVVNSLGPGVEPTDSPN